jgi:hypothetical protein
MPQTQVGTRMSSIFEPILTVPTQMAIKVDKSVRSLVLRGGRAGQLIDINWLQAPATKHSYHSYMFARTGFAKMISLSGLDVWEWNHYIVRRTEN